MLKSSLLLSFLLILHLPLLEVGLATKNVSSSENEDIIADGKPETERAGEKGDCGKGQYINVEPDGFLQ